MYEISVRGEPLEVRRKVMLDTELFLLVHDIFVVSYKGELYDLVMRCDLFSNDIQFILRGITGRRSLCALLS